ncbi:MAG: enoyl-CoA hydratase [Alphaproteobacteria bacterium]|nr:enoyl-CoA hydratase [Alphaproteobacteria bacterium]
MAYQDILYAVQDRVATVTLNRPDKLNAWTRVMEREVLQAMSEATADDGVRAIVLTGAGRGFCAGADMSLLQGIGDAPASGEPLAPAGGIPGGLDLPADWTQRYSYFPTVPKPILCAINGACAGLGLVMALFADLRFAAHTAVFTTAFARRGLIAEHGIGWMLPRLVGPQHALDLLLSARRVPAVEAQAMGLIARVLPAPDLMPVALSYARDLADHVSPRAMRVMKAQVYQSLAQNLAEATRLANAEMRASFKTEDFREGVAHFVEKRPARFSGR